MATLSFRKATREQAKLRAALIGPAGTGKTYSALAIGCEIARLIRESGRGPGRVALIDTECGSSELYAGTFDFDVLGLERHSPLDYVAAIEAAEAAGFDVTIVDSLSHAWIGKDGALEQVDKAAARSSSGNSFTAWRDVTPKHMKLVEKILSCRTHLITTIRAKTAYVQEKDEKTGKTQIRKLGMEAIQRDGLEFEFGLVGDLDLSNNLRVSKTRLDGVIAPGEVFERPGAALGRKIYAWLMDGAAPAPLAAAVTPPIAAPAAPPSVPRAEVAAWAGNVAAELAASASGVAVEMQLVPSDSFVPTEPTGATCSVCGSPQLRSPSGDTCANGHGGAPPTTALPPVVAAATIAAGVDDAFRLYMINLTRAETLADLDQRASRGAGKPAKGTPAAELAGKQYHALRTEILKQQAARDAAATDAASAGAAS